MLRSKVQLLLQLINNSLQNIFFVFLRTIYVFEFDICITILLLAIYAMCLFLKNMNCATRPLIL